MGLMIICWISSLLHSCFSCWRAPLRFEHDCNCKIIFYGINPSGLLGLYMALAHTRPYKSPHSLHFTSAGTQPRHQALVKGHTDLTCLYSRRVILDFAYWQTHACAYMHPSCPALHWASGILCRSDQHSALMGIAIAS